MTTPIQYSTIDDVAYDVDINKNSVPYRADTTFYENMKYKAGQQYQVIKTVDTNDKSNSQGYFKNGFQAMAVAPVINGAVDHSQTIIAYAGTNQNDLEDLVVDVRQVVAGDKSNDSQFRSAEQFYQEVTKLPHVRVVSTTGHSLGGALAQKVSATHHLPSVTFSTAGVGTQLTNSEKKWLIGEGKKKVKNYMHRGDYISSATAANKFGTAIYALDYGDGSILSGHMLNSYKFNQEGDILTKANIAAEKAHKATAKKIAKIKKLRSKFMASGSLSAGQEQLLDEYEALARVEGMQEIVDSQLGDLQNIYEEAISEARGIWQLTIKQANAIGPNLSPYEQEAALNEGGVTEETMKTKPIKEYEESIHKIQEVQKEYQELHQKIKEAIHHQVSTDQEMAQQIKGFLW